MTNSADERLKDIEGRIAALETQCDEQVLNIETKARRDQSTDEAEKGLRHVQADLTKLRAEQAELQESETRML